MVKIDRPWVVVASDGTLVATHRTEDAALAQAREFVDHCAGGYAGYFVAHLTPKRRVWREVGPLREEVVTPS